MKRIYTTNQVAQLIADDLKKQGIKALRVQAKAEYDVQPGPAMSLIGAALGGKEHYVKPRVRTRDVVFLVETDK